SVRSERWIWFRTRLAPMVHPAGAAFRQSALSYSERPFPLAGLHDRAIDRLSLHSLLVRQRALAPIRNDGASQDVACREASPRFALCAPDRACFAVGSRTMGEARERSAGACRRIARVVRKSRRARARLRVRDRLGGLADRIW